MGEELSGSPLPDFYISILSINLEYSILIVRQNICDMLRLTILTRVILMVICLPLN